MTKYTLHLQKMKTSLDSKNNACYQLNDLDMNSIVGKAIKLNFLNEVKEFFQWMSPTNTSISV